MLLTSVAFQYFQIHPVVFSCLGINTGTETDVYTDIFEFDTQSSTLFL